MSTWDLLVVGGGTAGIVAAKTAAGLGARVLLVERHRTGGDCLWTGCVPSKALLAAAGAAAAARTAGRLGVQVDGVRVDFARVRAHVQDAIAAIAPVDSPQALEEAGVRVRAGTLRFTGPGTAEVDDEPLSFRQAVVCTGSSPVVPPVPGLADVAPLTSDDVWDMDRLPGRLVVLGGGSIGCELGQAFARLGAEVTVVEAADRVLAAEDPAASAVLARALAADGVALRAGAPAVEVRPAGAGHPHGSGRLLLEDGSHVDFDRILVAVGRRPGTEGLGLASAGVAVTADGHVAVDDRLRTTNPRIWAAGDVTGHPQFTHLAGVHGSLAATNAVLGLRRRVRLEAVPRVTYTHPEVASVGVGTGDTASGGRDGHTLLHRDHDDVDRAVTEAATGGFTRLLTDRRGRLVGATVVGPRAGETLGELTLAVRRGLRTRDLAGTTHPYPTWNDGAWQAAVADVRARLEAPAAATAVRVLAAGRRAWVRTARGPGLSAGRGSRRRSAAPR